MPPPPPPAASARSFWGEALVWGNTNPLSSIQACCDACTNYKPTAEKDNLECNGGFRVWG